MISFRRFEYVPTDFETLITALNQELVGIYPDYLSFYAEFNDTNLLTHVLIAYAGEEPIACGGLKPFAEDALEVKRIFVRPPYRGKGISKQILLGLEAWAKEMGYTRCVLETGTKQHAALALYRSVGYQPIPCYEQYESAESSICFEKGL